MSIILTESFKFLEEEHEKFLEDPGYLIWLSQFEEGSQIKLLI